MEYYTSACAIYFTRIAMLNKINLNLETLVKVDFDCTRLKTETKDLIQTVHKYELLDEVIQPS